MSGSAKDASTGGVAYDAARRGAMVVARSDRAQLRAHGRDPVRMIQGLITNDLEGAGAGRAVYATMLTPKGRMIADLRIIRNDDGSLLLDLDRSALDATRAHLGRYVPPLFARFEPVNPELATLAVHGPAAARIVRDACGIDVDDAAAEYDVARADDSIAIVSRDAGVFGIDLLVPVDRAEPMRAALLEAGAVQGDADTLELLRVEAGRPRWGAELTDERIPLEAELLDRAISTSKGCYTGQEVIIRILHRGHVNWHLRGMTLGHAAPPAPGTELAAEPGGRTVARVTSALRSPALGETIALGYVRREIESGSTLRLPDGDSVRVVALPFRREGEG